MRERRRYTRFEMNWGLTYVVPGPVEISSPSTLHNIGLGGVRMRVSRAVSVGERLRIELQIPSEPQALAMVSKVVWVKPRTDGGTTWDAGVKFVQVTPQARAILMKHLAELPPQVVIEVPVPTGVNMLSYFYLLNALFFGCSIIGFYEYIDLVISGRVVVGLERTIIVSFLLFVPLFLFFGMRLLSSFAYYLALVYQSFFLVNGLLILLSAIVPSFPIKPLVRMTGVQLTSLVSAAELGPAPSELWVYSLVVLIGIGVISYLIRQQKVFA